MPAVLAGQGATRTVVVNTLVPIRAVAQKVEAVEVLEHSPAVLVDADTQRTVEVSSPGIQGPKGDPGEAPPLIRFAYGDASPRAVWVVGSDVEVLMVSLQIKSPFDGTGAAIALGTAVDPEMLMRFDQTDPHSAAVYEVSPRVALPAGTALVLTIQPGAGATTGAGEIAMQLAPIH
jgi:hypothetical protein